MQRKRAFFATSVLKLWAGVGIAIATPLAGFAAVCQPGERTLCGIVGRAVEIIGLAIPLAFGAALAFFLWSVARFIFSAGDAQAAKEKRAVLWWGVITLAVLTGVWGIVAILQQTFFGQTSP